MVRILSIVLIWLAVSLPAVVLAGARDDQRLITGARGKIMPVVVAAVEAGAHIDARDEVGRTALMWSSFQDHGPMTAYLIDHGADVNALDKRGRTALMWAAIAGRSAAVATLLGHGADRAIADVDGRTAAMHAAAEGHADLARALAD